MPLYRRLPKRGFRSRRPDRWCAINLGQIQSAIDRGRLSANAPITEDALLRAGLLSHGKLFARILGEGELHSSIHLQVPYASKGAIEKVIHNNGSVEVLSPEDVSSILPSRYTNTLGKGDNLRRDIFADVFGNTNMHLRSEIYSDETSLDDKIDLNLSVDFTDDAEIDTQSLNQFEIYFDSFGAKGEIYSIPLSDVFGIARKHGGVYQANIEFTPTERGEVVLFVGINQGGHRLVQRFHTLRCV